MMNGHVGRILREEIPKTGISGNGESELAHVHYPDTQNHDTIITIDQGDSTGPYIWPWTKTEDQEFGKQESGLTRLQKSRSPEM
jgi:hypothetical protein